MATWGDIKRQYGKAARPLKELLERNMAIEMGNLSPWATPMGIQMAGQIRSMATLGTNQLAQLLNRAGTPGGMLADLEREMLGRATEAAQRGVTGLYQKYDPTALAVERSRHGLELAKLRNEFYRNQLLEDAMNAQDSGFGGLGDLISGAAGLLTSSALGNPLGSLFGALKGGLGSLFGRSLSPAVPISGLGINLPFSVTSYPRLPIGW